MNDDEIKMTPEEPSAEAETAAEAAETFEEAAQATAEEAAEVFEEAAQETAQEAAQAFEDVSSASEPFIPAEPPQPVMDYETWRQQYAAPAPEAPVPEQAAPRQEAVPPYGYGAWQTPPPPPQGYGQPVYPGQPGYYAPQGGPAFTPAAVKQKKKMSTGLKVFIIIACVLAGLALLGFGGYVAYSALHSQGPVNLIEEYREELPEDFPFGELPFGGQEDGDSSRPSRPDGGQKPYSRRDDGDNESGNDSQAPGWDEDGEPEENPDFGVTPPDVDDPMPEIDVTPGKGIDITPASGKEMSAKEVYEKVVKSTVTVAATREVGDAVQTGTGTGIVATSDGYIITNAHVVLNSKSCRVRITTYDGKEYDAVVVGVDRSTDLAVLKTNDYDFTPAEFGDSDALSVGDTVIAIGNPGGVKFSGSMTGGYVSGLDREVGAYSENGMTYIQTDAAINPGNSGGPLVNLYGQVVGINSSKIVSSAYEGMGFAIPVSKAESILNELMAGGYVKGRVRMGITGMDVANTSYSMMGITDGFLITAINDDSSFAGTEARVGDIITAIDGETVTKLEEISNLLLKYSPGDEITVTLTRVSNSGASTLDVKITLLEDKGETQQ